MLGRKLRKQRCDQIFKVTVPPEFIGIKPSVTLDGPANVAHSMGSNGEPFGCRPVHRLWIWFVHKHITIGVSNASLQASVARLRYYYSKLTTLPEYERFHRVNNRKIPPNSLTARKYSLRGPKLSLFINSKKIRSISFRFIGSPASKN